MNNPITEKSVRFLAQPYTIAALLLYAVNEFILQRYFPTWISGKLSDFAWLFIAPVILTLLLSLILPSKRANPIPLLAYVLTAIGFTAIKTIPIVNEFLLQTWQTIFHYPAAIAMDATDLLALLILPLSWRLWRNKENRYTNRIHQTASIISFFALLTMADAPAYEAGIYDLFAYKDQIIARSTVDFYCSNDGGLNWQDCYFGESVLENLEQPDSTKQITIPDTNIEYRIDDLGLLQISENSGESWQYIYTHKNLSKIEEYYLKNYHPYGYFPFSDGGDLFYDPTTNNLIMTMGRDGVVILDSNNNFLQVGIDWFIPDPIPDKSLFRILIVPYILPSVFIIIILFSIHTMLFKNNWYWLVVIFSFGMWFVSFIPDQINLIYSLADESAKVYFIIFSVMFLLILFSIRSLLENKETINWKTTILASLPAGLFFFLTNVLWFMEIIPSRDITVVISYSIIVLSTIYAIYQSYQYKKTLREKNE